MGWDLMLKEREIFRVCFDDFDYDKIAEYGDDDIQRILDTEDMIKSKGKVAAVIHNAKCFQKICKEFGSFCDHIWAYSDHKTILYNGHNKAGGKVPVSNGLPKRISRDKEVY